MSKARLKIAAILILTTLVTTVNRSFAQIQGPVANTIMFNALVDEEIVVNFAWCAPLEASNNAN